MWTSLMLDHPHAVGETYLEHQQMAFGFAGRLWLASMACLLHGVVPGLCVKTGSRMIGELHRDMVANRRRAAAGDVGGAFDYAI